MDGGKLVTLVFSRLTRLVLVTLAFVATSAVVSSIFADPVFKAFRVRNFPIGLAFDGQNIWVALSEANAVTKMRASDGKRLGTFPVGSYPGKTRV